ncbi:MAG: hypothetical protein WBG90_02850 [Saonia sp.]
MDRKTFITKNIALGGMALTAPTFLFANAHQNPQEPFDKELIWEFVLKAHNSLEDTKRIIETYPLLLNCANQTKKGDFETAVGGASHMGRRDIADLLVARGARLDIFNYAFLGYDDFIKKLVSDYPQLLNAPGPHGFTLLHHAEVGERTALAAWLRSKGLTETFFKGVFG